MRVCLLTYSTRPRGGVVHTLALAEALAHRGVDVTVATLGRGGDRCFFRPVDPGVRVHVVPFEDRAGEPVGDRIVRSIRVLGAGVDSAAYDVVHAQDCISANAVPGSIRTVHHIDRFTTPQLAACHERAIVEPPVHVCVSAAVAAELRDGWGIEATVIPNGVDAARFAAASGPAGAAGRAQWRDAVGGPYGLVVGGIEPRKGTIDLVEPMARFWRQRRLRFVIAGGETLFDHRAYRETFERRCRDAALIPRVLGTVQHERLPTLVAGADVFLFPSTKEGFGLAAMEALAAGVPVVARDLPVLREVLGDAVRYGADPAGFGSSVQAALDGPDLGRRRAGQHLAARYTWEAAAAAHEALYERWLTGGAAPSSAVTGSGRRDEPRRAGRVPSGERR